MSDAVPDPRMHGHKTWSFLWGEKVSYRGITLRSKLEFRFVKAIEIAYGVVLGETLLYEPKSLRVRYRDPDSDKERGYWPDFWDPSRDVVYEVKHAGRAFTPVQEAKREAFLREHPCKAYVMLTEKEVNKLEREVALGSRGQG